MGFFDDEKNVDQYIAMTEGYDFSFIRNTLNKYLPSGSSLLEIGMGPGKDLHMLSEDYNVTGSDSSKPFIDRFRKEHPNSTIDILQLDAKTLEIDIQYDCIYSNKVLMHLEKDEMSHSLKRQSELITHDGIIFATLWYGDSRELFGDLLFQYYNENSITSLIPNELSVVSLERYTEEEEGDSFYLVLKKSQQ